MSAALGIDLGSTNVKAVVVRDDGTVVGSASRPLVTTRSSDVATQDPDAVWSAVVAAVGAACHLAGDAARQVAVVGTCAQYSSIVPATDDGTPTGPLKLYLDRRGTDDCLAILGSDPEAFGLWVERHGVPPVGGGLSLGHLLWFMRHDLAVHDATDVYLEPADWVTTRLTGCASATQGSMFTSLLCDNRALGVTTYDDELVRRAGVDPTRLPPLVAPGAHVGELLHEYADLWGVPTGVPVVAAMNDSHAGAFATGAWHGDGGGVMVGTTAVLLDHLTAPVSDLGRGVVALPGPLADRWLVWGENGLAGRVVDHVLGEFVYADDTLGHHTVADRFATLDATLASVPPGSDGVLFAPWLAGSMAPIASDTARGAYLNLTLDTTRAHLVRAAVEGTAHNLAWLLPVVDDLCGRPMRDVVLGGGAVRSSGWVQVLADVLGRPVRPLVEAEVAVARAVALTALVGVEAAADDPDGLLVRTSDVVEPDPSTRATYDAAQQQFVAAFEALRSLGAMSVITPD